MIQPLHDRIIVKRTPAESKTAFGLIIPDQSGNPPDTGEVIAAGDGRVLDNGKLIPSQIKIGDIVVFGENTGQPVKIDGNDFIVMREEDILGIVE